MLQAKELNTPLYKFLINSEFRWIRHVSLIIITGIIIIHGALITYEGAIDYFSLCKIIIFNLLVYLSAIYFNIYVLIPLLLLKEKYIQYLFSLLISVFTVLILDTGGEYCIHQYYNIPFSDYSFFSLNYSFFSFLKGYSKFINFVTSVFITTFSFISITVIVFYKQWIFNFEKIEQLRTKQVLTELKTIKTNIKSEFIIDKLGLAAFFCKIDPEKSSKILLKLSKVLRYLLYDGDQEKVLLNSEIKFFVNYLELEKECCNNLNYNLIYSPSLSCYFIEPLSFISVVENILNNLSNNNFIDVTIKLKLELELEAGRLKVICINNQFDFDKETKIEYDNKNKAPDKYKTIFLFNIQ